MQLWGSSKMSVLEIKEGLKTRPYHDVSIWPMLGGWGRVSLVFFYVSFTITLVNPSPIFIYVSTLKTKIRSWEKLTSKEQEFLFLFKSIRNLDLLTSHRIMKLHLNLWVWLSMWFMTTFFAEANKERIRNLYCNIFFNFKLYSNL